MRRAVKRDTEGAVQSAVTSPKKSAARREVITAKRATASDAMTMTMTMTMTRMKKRAVLAPLLA